MKLVEDLTTDPQQLATANVSKLFRHLGGFDWSHIVPVEYKSEDGSWDGVSRRVFTGETGESSNFHLRYFEIAQGGYSTLEQHQHEHVVVAMRGQGHAIVGERRVELNFGDVLYVCPDEVHQLSNSHTEPFGFLCIVNAERDRPRPVDVGTGSSCD
jgi:S-methyl-1-thioxylulose 5-phosphate methylthiotransferase